MVRSPSFDSNGIKKGAWSEEEDEKLRAFIQRYGHKNWRLLPKYAGLARCGKSCRLRWENYLKPGVKKGNFTKEEEEMIIALHDQLGNKWSAIAAKFPGRTDNDIKNHWHGHLKKRYRIKQSNAPQCDQIPLDQEPTRKLSEREANHCKITDQYQDAITSEGIANVSPQPSRPLVPKLKIANLATGSEHRFPSIANQVEEFEVPELDMHQIINNNYNNSPSSSDHPFALSGLDHCFNLASPDHQIINLPFGVGTFITDQNEYYLQMEYPLFSPYYSYFGYDLDQLLTM